MISLGTANMGIGLSVRLVDHFTGPAAAVSGSMTALHTKARAMQMASLTMARNMGLGMTIAGGLITAGFANAAKAAGEFEYVMKGTQAVTQASQKDYEKMSQLAIDLSKSTVFSAQQIGSSFEYLGRAGFDPTDIYNTAKAVVALGAATDSEIAGKGGVGDMMTNMMTAFNMSSKQASRMADILTMATTRANIDIFDLHESLKYMGSVVSQLGVPFEDAASMIAVLGNAGIRGGIAGRGLANMYLYLARSVSSFKTKGQMDAFKAIGLHPDQLKDAKGELLPVTKIVEKFMAAIKTMPKVEAVAALQKLMNIRGERSFIPLLRDAKIGKGLKEMLHLIRDVSPGIAEKIAAMRIDTMKGDWVILGDVFHAFRIEVGKLLDPIVRPLLQGLTKIVAYMIKFTTTPIGKVVTVVIAIGFALMTVFGILTVIKVAIKMATMSTMMGASATMALANAWDVAGAAAARYGAIVQGATLARGGALIIPGVKGFQSAKNLAPMAPPIVVARAGWMTKFWNAIKWAVAPLIRFTGIILRFGGMFALMLGAAMLITTVMFSLKETVQAVSFIFLTLGNILNFIIDFVTNGLNWDVSMSRYRVRQQGIRNEVGYDKTDKQRKEEHIAQHQMKTMLGMVKEGADERYDITKSREKLAGMPASRVGPYSREEMISNSQLKGEGMIHLEVKLDSQIIADKMVEIQNQKFLDLVKGTN